MKIHSLEGPSLGRALLNDPMQKGQMRYKLDAAMSDLYQKMSPFIMAEAGRGSIGQSLLDYVRNMGYGEEKSPEAMEMRSRFEKGVIRPMNDFAEKYRNVEAAAQDPNWLKDPTMYKSMEGLAKATLDVGTLTNFANVTGGQALGYVSLDTRMARATVRPSSFTIYQALDKSLAWQIVDFWALAKATGGAPPGSAFANYSNVTSGSLATSAGTYDMMNILLKLALDGRAITTALASQNNYVNVSEQENTNAALVVLQTFNWAIYHGNSTIFTNQFDGISAQLVNNGFGASNVFDFYNFSNEYSASHSWSPELTLYNLIYEAAAKITSYGVYGHITHAFMSPTAMGALQGLTNTILNNVITQINELQDRAPIVINGNFIGMQTRYGHIQFPMDLFIDARDTPVQALVVDGHTQVLGDNTPNPTSITNPTTVTGTVNTSGANIIGSEFNGSYTPGGGGSYMYAVAATDSSMNETVLSLSLLVSGVNSGNSVSVAITPNGAAASAFRVFRSGLGGIQNNSTVTAGVTPAVAAEFRYIGSIAANGSNVVTMYDLNGGSNNNVLSTGTANSGKIPGSSTIFLLDMDPMDLAIDFRMLLPLVRVELFANNLYMPWAVASIGSLRLRVPQFHGLIKNYVPTNPTWNPLIVN
jgi:hypothetical protein